MSKVLQVDRCGINYYFVRVGNLGSEEYLCRDGEIKHWYDEKLNAGDIQFASEELAEEAKMKYIDSFNPKNEIKGVLRSVEDAYKQRSIPDEATRDKVEVMTAYLMQKKIEVTIHDGGLLEDALKGKWYDIVSEPTWNWDKATWRIKS